MQQKKLKKQICINTVKLVKIRKKEEVFIMNTKKMLIFVSLVGAVTAGAMIYFAGEEEGEGVENQVQITERSVEEQAPTQNPEYFTICLEGEEVILYKVTSGDKIMLDSVKIDKSYYPTDDIEALTRGIVAYNKEEGYKILENFAN